MKEFDDEEAKKFLKSREEKEKSDREKIRIELLVTVINILKEEIQENNTEVFLVGSIIRPFAFTSRSDIDIVVKNYSGDRFDLWTKLEKRIGRSVEIIPFETCEFKEFVLKEGLKVL